MIILIIISILNLIGFIFLFLKTKGLFKLKVTEEGDESYSIKYDNKEIYNAKPK